MHPKHPLKIFFLDRSSKPNNKKVSLPKTKLNAVFLPLPFRELLQELEHMRVHIAQERVVDQVVSEELLPRTLEPVAVTHLQLCLALVELV